MHPQTIIGRRREKNRRESNNKPFERNAEVYTNQYALPSSQPVPSTGAYWNGPSVHVTTHQPTAMHHGTYFPNYGNADFSPQHQYSHMHHQGYPPMPQQFRDMTPYTLGNSVKGTTYPLPYPPRPDHYPPRHYLPPQPPYVPSSAQMLTEIRGNSNSGLLGGTQLDRGSNQQRPPLPRPSESDLYPVKSCTSFDSGFGSTHDLDSGLNSSEHNHYYGNRNQDVRGSPSKSYDSPQSKRRPLRCVSPPPPDIKRKIFLTSTEGYYVEPGKEDELMKGSCTLVATEKVISLYKEFQEKVLSRRLSRSIVGMEDEGFIDIQDEDDKEMDEMCLVGCLNSEDQSDSDDSDEDRCSSSSDEEDQVAEEGVLEDFRKRKLEDPSRLHPEIWFNEKGETNEAPVCQCSTKDKLKGIRHSVYHGEKSNSRCQPLGNNATNLHHYWVTITPHANFMTERPTIIIHKDKKFIFEGFSLVSHSSLDDIPQCNVVRFNIEYTIHIVPEPIPENFCVQDLELFSGFLFHDVLELFDWDLSGSEPEDCPHFHFMPRFIHRVERKKEHELLSMHKVLEHLIKNAGPVMEANCFDMDESSWQQYADSCKNMIVMPVGKKPRAVRIDNLTRDISEKRIHIVHNGIRPVQLSYAGNEKYQKMWKDYLKLRKFIVNQTVPSRKNRDKLAKMKFDLDNLKMQSSMRRDFTAEFSALGMEKTGLKSDVCQHALVLPVLVHHIRYHRCLGSLEEKLDFTFKNKDLLKLALTHPSYHMNFGMNPDQARNSLSNCGTRQPHYGDRRIHHMYKRKRGINQLINIMSKLGKVDEDQSFMQNYERLEFLGDAVLEYICSVHLYFMFSDKPEGQLAVYRSTLVQNKYLAQLAKKINLDEYMQYSHGPDLCHEEDLNHAMANCFEALLAAVYIEFGLDEAEKLFVNLCFEEKHLREVWISTPKHPLQEQQPGGDRHLVAESPLLQKLEKFEDTIGIKFSHIRLLARALTHPQVGFTNLTLGNNQRMEFLGDAILQFVVSTYLYNHFPEHHEGHLTLLRSSLVNGRIQAKVAWEIGLDNYLHVGKNKVHLKCREKLMSELFEAFVAALFVDKGLEHVKVFCDVCLFPRLEEFIINQDWMDAKSQLQQCCIAIRSQGKSPDLPSYKILQNKGPSHRKCYSVAVYYRGKRIGLGEGSSIQQAEMAAAKDALASHYFPELTRQKRFLDRRHSHRRRNVPYVSPQNVRKNMVLSKDEPRWIEEVGHDDSNLAESDSDVKRIKLTKEEEK